MMAEGGVCYSQGARVCSLDEILGKIHHSVLDTPCTDHHLVKLAHHFTDWPRIAAYLEMTEQDEVAIRTKYAPMNYPDKQCIDMLMKWREKLRNRATYRSLATALYEAERFDLIDKLTELSKSLNSDCTINTHPTEPVPEHCSFSTIHAQHTLDSTPTIQKALRLLYPLRSNWQNIGTLLNVPQETLKAIKKDYKGPDNQLREMLNECLCQIESSLTWRELAEAVKFIDLSKAQEIEQRFISIKSPVPISKNTTSTTEEQTPHYNFVQGCFPASQQSNSTTHEQRELLSRHNARSRQPLQCGYFISASEQDSLLNILLKYGSYLGSRYQVLLSSASANTWPPPPTHKVFNLALIKKETVQRGRIDDKFIEPTITGKIDDILQKKIPIQLQNILKQVEGEQKQKMILIEGAPGSGKSTLSLHICQRWGEGKLFQEYKVVILVRLRDPEVQKAQSIADLLPSRNREMAKEVEMVITNCDGRGVLFVLDGWDELPSDLPQDCILHRLIKNPEKNPLHECAIIVTSRPVSSADLHSLVSSRIEVVGFTPTELRRYFTECLKGDYEAVQTLYERLKENPVIGASCYLPLYAAIIAHLYLASDRSLSTTVHSIFTSVVHCCLSRYMQERLGKTRQEATFETLDRMPRDLIIPFNHLCKLAFSAVTDNTITFTTSYLDSIEIPSTVSEVGLLQVVPSILSNGTSEYYCFLHLSVQELLAAVYISRMPASKQISTFQKLFGQPRFSAVFQFYAGITKLTTVRPWLRKLPRFLCPVPAGVLDLVKKIIRSQSTPLLISLLHCLCEAQDSSLCQFVAKEHKRKLNLGNTTLSPLDCLPIGYFLSCVCVTTNGEFTAYLYGSCIDDQCCEFLMRGLHKCLDSDHSKNTACLNMYLTRNRIHEVGADHIANILRTTTVLNKLYLTGNNIGMHGLKSIAESLTHNSSLVELSVSNCSVAITEENGPIVSQMLQKNNTLRGLYLSNNRDISNTGVFFISEGLKNNSTLQRLDLDGCNLTTTAVEYLTDALKCAHS